jgi:hypothetical protein
MPAATTHTEASRSTTKNLQGLLDDRASAKDIETFLDAMSPADRVQEVLSITGRGVKRLYDAVAGSAPLSLDDFAKTGEPVIFEGRNSLPMFTRFQKRFSRQGDEVVGYNHQTMSFVTGPGFFVVKPPSGEGEHGDELYFDYTAKPGVIPTGWPEFKANERGLSRAVYMNMIDYVRRVARGIVVGKAYKLGVEQKAWFSLSRPL